MSTAKFDTLQNAAGTVSVPVNTVVNGSAKAWVNFNGTGTVAIRQAFNVSSITDNGTGDYTVNFTTAMADANYGSVISVGKTTSADVSTIGAVTGVAPTSSAFRFGCYNGNNGSAQDETYVSVAIFR